MSIIRVKKTRNYTVMSNYHLRDINISLKAKGLISQMLSLPDDWDYSIKGLSKINKESESSIKSALSELKKGGYLTVHKLTPAETDNGRYQYEYDLFEVPPKTRDKKQGVEFQPLEFQPLEFLPIEFLPLENEPQINKEKQNTEKQNKEEKITECMYSTQDSSSFRNSVIKFFSDNNLNGDAEKFIDYYTEIYLMQSSVNWEHLACKWSDNEFVDLPPVWYEEDKRKTLIQILNETGYEKLVSEIIEESEKSGCYQIRAKTLNKLNSAINELQRRTI